MLTDKNPDFGPHKELLLSWGGGILQYREVTLLVLIFLYSLPCPQVGREGERRTLANFRLHKISSEKKQWFLQAHTVAIRTLDRPWPQTGAERLSGRVSTQSRAGYYAPSCKTARICLRSRRAAALLLGFTLCRNKPLPLQKSS